MHEVKSLVYLNIAVKMRQANAETDDGKQTRANIGRSYLSLDVHVLHTVLPYEMLLEP